MLVDVYFKVSVIIVSSSSHDERVRFFKRVYEDLEISWQKTQKCIDDSFSSKDRTSPTTTNKLIDDELKYWRDYGTNIYPSVVINKKTFRG